MKFQIFEATRGKRGEKITGLRGGRSVALNDKDAVLLNIYLAMMDEGKELFFERCQRTSCHRVFKRVDEREIEFLNEKTSPDIKN